MAHWCETCGQSLPEGEEPAAATWIGAPDDDHVHSFRKPGRPKKSGNEKKILGLVAVAVLIWGLFVGLGRIVTPSDAIDEQAAAEIEEERLEREAEAAAAEREAIREEAFEEARAEALEQARIAEVDGDYGAADAAPGFPDASLAGPDAPIDDGRAEPGSLVQVQRLQRQLERRYDSALVAYRSDRGVVVIDLVEGSAVVSGVSDELGAAQPGMHLLRSGADSYGIDPESLQVTQVAEGSSLVLTQALDGNTYYVDAKSLALQASLVEVVSDGVYNFHRIPAGGLQLRPIDGLGLLAVPKAPTGETLIAGAETFITLSENRVLAGTDQALLEQVCSTEVSCSLVINQLESEQQVPVPSDFVRFGDQYTLAPSGALLLRYSPEGFAEVFAAGSAGVAGNDSIAWVTGAGLESAAWGPNSDFIIWLDSIGDAKIKIMFTDDRDWLAVDLRDLGAPPPASPEIIVFSAEG